MSATGNMLLYHRFFCPHSRFVRLVLAERAVRFDAIEVRPWAREEAFLRLNPEGTTPVLVEPGGMIVPGAEIIADYCEEAAIGQPPRPLRPQAPAARVEMRRLMRWFSVKFFEEVSGPLVTEKIDKRFIAPEHGGGPPDTQALRAGRTNMRYHLSYLGWLAARNDWLAGPDFSYADLMAAAHLSVVDYLGDVPWAEDPNARDWYARVKSRPSFRPLIADRVTGMAPSATYADLDF